MVKPVLIFACLLLLGVMLTACGGSDDPTATVVPPTATTAPVDDASDEEPTAPGEPSSTVETTPTSESAETATNGPVTTPTPRPTFTPRPEPTPTSNALPTEDAGEGEEVPDGEDVDDGGETDVDSILLDMLITEGDLPDEWVLYQARPAPNSVSDVTFCNAEPFDGQGERLGSVEAEFDQDPTNGPFLLQGLAAYPEAMAIEAFNHTRQVTSECSDWVDEDGTEYVVQVVDVPAMGDESLGIHMTFDVPEGSAMADFTFVRVGGLLVVMAWLTLDEVDTAQFNEITRTAIDRVEASDFRP